MLPKLKRKIKSFLLEEEGKISKASFVYLGAALAAASLASVNAQWAGSCGGEDGGAGSCGCVAAGGAGEDAGGAGGAGSGGGGY